MNAIRQKCENENELIELLIQKKESMKEKNPLYSYRAMARDIGCSHPSLLAFIHKKRKLTPAMAYKLGGFLKLEESSIYSIIVSVIDTSNRDLQ